MSNFIKIFLTLFTFLHLNTSTQAQNFVFNTLESQRNCASPFKLDITIEIVGVKVTNVYYDNPSQNAGSFSFEVLFKYKNLFSGSIPTSSNTFWTYNFTLRSTNTNIGSRNAISNNIGNVPMRSTPEGILHSTSNNITYNGSASRLGFRAGQTYTEPEVLELFQFSAFNLMVNLPCLSTSASGIKHDIILPIVLEKFEANTIGKNKVALQWRTAATDDTQYFIIERSADAISWQAIDSLPIQINGVYYYSDEKAAVGDNYYRLKGVNIEDTFSYSHVVVATVAQSANFAIKAYPNPTTSYLYIENLQEHAVVQLIDMKGSIAFENRNISDSSMRIDLPNLPNGIYLLSVILADGSQSTQKISIAG